MVEAFRQDSDPTGAPPAAISQSHEVAYPLAPVARAYVNEYGATATDPYSVLAFIHDQLQPPEEPSTPTPQSVALEHADIITEPPRRRVPPLLPPSLVTRKLDEEVLPIHRQADTDKEALLHRAESEKMIRKAVLYHTLPEVTQAIHLLVQLKSLGREAEAQAAREVLEAYGRVIAILPKDRGILKWAADKLEQRQQS